MMYGTFEMNQPKQDVSASSPEGEVMEMEPFEPEQTEEPGEQEVIEANVIPTLDEDVPLAHRVASLFEKVVVSTYEFFLSMLYKIADAFF